MSDTDCLVSDTDCIVIKTEIVLAALRNYPGKSLSSAELQTMAGATERQVRAAISRLRRGGWLIVGDRDDGYRFARNMADTAPEQLL